KDHPCRIGGQIGAIDCPDGLDTSRFAALDKLTQLTTYCAVTALRDAGWWDERDRAHIGMVLGSGAEWLRGWEADHVNNGDLIHHPERELESQVTRASRFLGLAGPTMTVAAACASGNYAL